MASTIQQQVAKALGLAEGELYAGIVLSADGESAHHLVLLPGQATEVSWAKANEWAASVGGELPTRAEQSILFGNMKAQFEQRYYWSSETHASDSDSAWLQNFTDGCQYYHGKSNTFRARAVRRLPI